MGDPYGHAAGGLPYGTTARRVAMACGNADEGVVYAHIVMDLVGEILQTTTISHE